MSDIPTTPPPKKPRRKVIKLPTPPPDPTLIKEPDFFEYLESLHKSINPTYARSTSTFGPAIATDEAFDHLEKLYKLMEQMLELREQNAKLHRRIRDLEHLNNIEKMHKQLEIAGVHRECPELDKDTAFAETILESILSETKKDCKQKQPRPSILRRQTIRRASADNHSKDVSKWTKVKAAFKWEKASPSMSDSKSQDSGVGGMIPVNVEIARYLRVPSTSDDLGHSADSGAAGISTPGSLSTTSSNEDFHRTDLRTPCGEDLRSSEEEHNYIPHPKDDSGLQKNLKEHRTPWAKMKDIIQTRNSFKKKQRLSAQSDDIQIDVELCSDTEDVFEENSNEIPSHIVARYQQMDESDNKECRKISKWTKVKKAFLSNENPQQTSKQLPSNSEPQNSDNIEEEIQKNYRQLQKKLSLEFQEKISEWERLKQNSPGTSNPSASCTFLDEPHDPTFIKKLEEWQKIKQPSTSPTRTPIPMTRELDLPPDFKKKLQEWEKIKKSSAKESSSQSKKKIGDFPRWKSLSGHRSETTPATIEIPTISEDFRKKLEEWKQIKATGDINHQRRLKEKTPSPKLSRKNSSPKHSKKLDKELHWFEKELNKIEKEKSRLERERQKFLEREERLSKLRRSVVGTNKKEVLIHTPSGFYRFEGISRKFTRKLYEWEKAQGIGPEASTFALLSSSYIPEYKTPKRNRSSISPPLMRSKSADSIAISALNLTCPLMSQQPSSLSLNDVDELEKECLRDSKYSSMQYISDGDEEPEALIVEVEDYEEETASPLQTFIRREQRPVYQREEKKTMCEGETVAAPKIQRSESTRAQTNYNLIEDIFYILRTLSENEFEIITIFGLVQEEERNQKIQEYHEKQKILTKKVISKLLHLQEANLLVVSSITKEGSGNVVELLEAVQDLSAEILQMTENLGKQIEDRQTGKAESNFSLHSILDNVTEIRNKMLELRRNLSYVCAASDLTAPIRKKSITRKKTVVQKTTSNESKDSSDTSQKKISYVKSETKSSTQGQGAVKKKIKYRQKSLQGQNTDSEEDEMDHRKNKHKKLTRTRSTSESNNNNPIDDNTTTEKFIVPTEINYLNKLETNPEDSPVTVFVKTTRKLFTPIGESNVLVKNSEEKEESRNNLPPLPPSPMPQRRILRDVSPNIKIMLAKYNQKLNEQDNTNIKSGGSSGSGSPIAWRSPTAERRVKAQTERYQEALTKLSPLLGGRREVQKSASVGYMQSGNVQVTVPIIRREQTETRQRKLQKAKEEFLNSSPVTQFPTRNRLSQISVESESSSCTSACAGALIKSASAGMINVDADVYKQFDPEIHGGSLPRNTGKPKDGFLGGRLALSNITSKFRKVKMRRGKEPKMNVVSTLCRQSLVVDITGEQENRQSDSDLSSSWIKKAKFFKK